MCEEKATVLEVGNVNIMILKSIKYLRVHLDADMGMDTDICQQKPSKLQETFAKIMQGMVVSGEGNHHLLALTAQFIASSKTKICNQMHEHIFFECLKGGRYIRLKSKVEWKHLPGKI